MTVIVMKFGGSCLIDKTAFRKILKITRVYSSVKRVYIVSALKGITDLLLKMVQNVENETFLDKNMALFEKRHFDIIEKIFKEDSKEFSKTKEWLDKKLSKLEDIFADIKEFGLELYYQDYILSFGEILSTYILTQYLNSRGFESVFIPANELLITNDEFGNAYPLYDLTNARVSRFLIPFLENPKKNTIICITGFIGRNKIGNTTTLGRGGSDYTATILAHSIYEMGGDEDIRVILWKDVNGLLVIDPNYVPKASLIRNLDYIEAKHIANFGAKVLHPKCLEAIEKKGIPLEIRNFNNPLEKLDFTTISNYTDKSFIKGISAVEDAVIITISSGSLVDVPGVLAKIFKIMKKNNVSVSLVAQSASEVSTSFMVKKEDAKRALRALNQSEYFSNFFEIKSEEVAIVNITGFKVLDNLTKVKIFQALEKKQVKVKALTQGIDEINFSIVISRKNLIDAIKVIHRDLYEDFE